MSKAIEKITAALAEVHAAWAHSSEKYRARHEPDEMKPAYHIHPDASFPDVADVRRFDTQAQIWKYIEFRRKLRAVNKTFGQRWNETDMESAEGDALAREWSETVQVLTHDYEEDTIFWP